MQKILLKSSWLFTWRQRVGGGFDCELIEKQPGRIVFSAKGKAAKSLFGKEGGVYRWQRRPKNDKRGRTHTSTITVAILEEFKKKEVVINPRDLEYKYSLSSGPGGQNVQKNMTAVTLIHKPTGLRVRVETKSQKHNKIEALSILKSRLSELASKKSSNKRNDKRKKQLGHGERSDKRRTIAIQRDEVIDHLTGRRMKAKKYLKGFIEDLQ
jgi:peptide chain release factor 1